MIVRGAQFFCFMACKITYYYAVPAVSVRPVSDFYCTTYSRRKQAAVHDHHGNWRQPDVSSRRDIVEKFINKWYNKHTDTAQAKRIRNEERQVSDGYTEYKKRVNKVIRLYGEENKYGVE